MLCLRLYRQRKKATNITLSADALSEAKSLGINISQACEQFLRDLVACEQVRRWEAPFKLKTHI